MHDVALFVEDDAHRQIIGPLVERIAKEQRVSIRLHWRTAVRGYGRVLKELRDCLRDPERMGATVSPHLIIIATDANCAGQNHRAQQLRQHIQDASPPVIPAIPDPHVERWLLLDGAAFKTAVGQGCSAPDQKCDRNRYKQRLIEAIRDAGVTPILGGLEYAEDIVRAMDIGRAAQADRSFGRFVDGLRAAFRAWEP